MLLTIDLDTEQLVEWPGGMPVTTLALKRIETTQDSVQFIRDGVIVPVGVTGRFVAKKVGDYSGNFILDTGNWQPQAGAPYLFTYSRNTPVIIALFTPVTPEPTEWCRHPVTPPIPQAATLMGEVRWADPSGYPHTSAPFWVELENEVIQGTETNSMDDTPGFLNWSFITLLTGGVLATDLDAQPTAGRIAFGMLVNMTGVTDPATGQLLNAGGLTVWEWRPWPVVGQQPAAGFGIVVPLDAAVGTNEGYWVKVQ